MNLERALKADGRNSGILDLSLCVLTTATFAHRIDLRDETLIFCL